MNTWPKHEMLVARDVRKDAVLSEDGLYRYSLTRDWWVSEKPFERSLKMVTWVMLNPSTADALVDDPTIRRCFGFSFKGHFNRMTVVNLFPLRATDPKVLYKDQQAALGDPAAANQAILDAARLSDTVVCAWGVHGALGGRGAEVLSLLKTEGFTPYCLGLTKAGHPKHPLYLPTNSELIAMP